MKILFFFTFIIMMLVSCGKSPEAHAPNDYIQALNSWHAKRVANLREADGWLSLVGLEWLQEGTNSFGAAAENSIHFPKDKAAPVMGEFILSHNEVTATIQPGVTVTVDGKPFSGGPLKSDADGKPTIMHYRSLLWYVIKRGDRFGIRIKDTLAATRTNFKGIERFPADTTFRVQATFIPSDTAKTISIPTAIGTIEEEPSPGTLHFTLNGQKLSMDPIGTPEESSWFIVFADRTSGESTYGAGRFLSIPAPDSTGVTIIDFNRAYNPPCVFTPYATCPLPPVQNNLPVEIRAGEKITGFKHHH